jgi:glycosyltransferase involved in cell wall biosynthesis
MSRRVAFVVESLSTGGVERHAATICRSLEARGHTVDLVCVGSSLSPVAVPAAVVRLAWTLRRERVEVVMSASLVPGIVARLAAALARVPVRIKWQHNFGHLGSHGRKERAVERVLGRLTTRYVAVCYSQLNYLRSFMGLPEEKLAVVRNGVDVVDDDAAPPRDRRRFGDESVFVVGIVAVLRPEKDHRTLLRAFSRLVASGREDARLVVIGDGPERAALELEAKELGLDDTVVWLGNRDDVGELLGDLDVVALTSVNIECLPYAVLEAMAAARPVVATAVGGVPELVAHGKTGLLAVPGNAASVADALEELRSSRETREAMGAAARTRCIEQFSHEASVTELERMLEDLLADR